jgi:Protein of unknown function (DUF3892)
MRYQVTCVKRRVGARQPYDQIEGLGSSRWFDAEAQIIREIESRTNSYYLALGTGAVELVVAMHDGRKYLTTNVDGLVPKSLLGLPDCHNVR